MNKFVKYLLCFFVGFLLARMIGDGFGVGGETVPNLCPNGTIDPMVILKEDYNALKPNRNGCK